LKLHYNKDSHDFWVTENGVQELIEKCEAKLAEIGLNEFITTEHGDTRSVDLAMLNPLLLACFAGQPVIDDAHTVAVLEKIETELLGHIGLRRYASDLWDGRDNRHDFDKGEEAQWVHGSPQMSYIYGDLYQRTGDERYYEKQVLHFNRALASISPRWLTPEAWIVDAHTRNWVADTNEPLAWAQSMFVLAIAGMKASIAKKDKAV
jgi:GH15 family glucan-1,4-alpha-glucosidase